MSAFDWNFYMGVYYRAANLFRIRGLKKHYLLARSLCLFFRSMVCALCIVIMYHYLIIKSPSETKEYNEVLQVINDSEICANMTQSGINFPDRVDLFEDTSYTHVQNSTLNNEGRIYEAMDNRPVAINCYKQALHYDVHSYQALEALVQNQMLSASEERELLESLPLGEQLSEAESELLQLLYERKLKKYQEPSKKLPLTTCHIKGIPVMDRLRDNLDMQVCEAERLYYNCDYHKCFSLTERILKKDPYHSSCLPVHIACLVELKKTNALFHLAHKLVDLYPDMALAWFAVGCYYYSIGKSDPARRYLAKATSLDRLFGPAWLAYGHSFAVENEHDQAMAAYFKASQLMKGCHLPLLYIGLECGLTNNLKLADKFFQQAQGIAPNDPFVIHEMGVISFSNGDWKTAEQLFLEAMKRIQSGLKDVMLPSKWEPLLNNLGHVCRKMKKYEEALDYHQQALVLNPLNPSTYSAIGFIYALMGNHQEAVDAFHRALGLRRDDTFTTTMLSYVMEQLIDESPPYPDAPMEIPKYKFPSVRADLKATTEPPENINSVPATAPDQNIDKLRVNLFSGWGEDSGKIEDNNSDKVERSRDIVNYSTADMSSEVEMLDSSTAHIEYS